MKENLEKLWNWFTNLSTGKKVWVIAGVFFLFVVVVAALSPPSEEIPTETTQESTESESFAPREEPTPEATPREEPATSKEEPEPPPKPKPKPPSPGVSYAVITRVIDGDTVETAGGKKVRYIGINTPETYQDYGSEATAKNKELVNGKKVKLVKDVSETDKYGRLLRYVYVGNLFVNAELVKQGYANAATYPPDVKHADLFKKLESEARNAGRGLWAQKKQPAATGGG